MPPLVGLFYVAVAEPSGRTFAKTVVHQVLAALADPLALFSQRSPGMRVGALLSTKGKTGPQERVLSTVRDREPPPVLDTPAPTTVASIPLVPPQYENLPTDRTLGALPFLPQAPFLPPSFIPGGFTPQTPPTIITPPEPPGTPPGGGPPGPPGGPPPGGPPPGEPPGPPGPPGPPDTPPPETPVIPIPEPSTWTLMLFGFFALVAARRVRKSRTVRGG